MPWQAAAKERCKQLALRGTSQPESLNDDKDQLLGSPGQKLNCLRRGCKQQATDVILHDTVIGGTQTVLTVEEPFQKL